MLGLALAIILAVYTPTQARVLHSTAGITFLPAEGRACSAVCSKPLVLGSAFSAQPPSYGCRSELDSGSFAFGYQSGASQCTAAFAGQLAQTTKYSCACLDSGSTTGLDTSVAGSCAQACGTSLDGQSGMPLMSGANYICMPTSEMGVTNHYGSIGNGCEFVSNNVAQSTTAFSCVCNFSSGFRNVAGNAVLVPTPAPLPLLSQISDVDLVNKPLNLTDTPTLG